MSSLVKTMEWWNSADSSSIVGRGYLSGIMISGQHTVVLHLTSDMRRLYSISRVSCKRFNSRDTSSRTENERRRNFRVNLGAVNKLGNFPKPVNTDVGLYTLSFTVIFVTDAGRSKTLPYMA